MAEYPTLAAPYSSRKLITTFRGYHRNPKIGDGEFYHMENLTGDLYPLLSVRKPRGTLRQLTAPRALRGKSKLAWVDGTSLFYGEQDLTSYFIDAGFFLSDREDMLPKQLVSMGAYLIVYPDKLYINTENYTDCGSIEARFSTDEGTPVTFTPCTAEGTAYAEPHIGTAAPESPENGSLWLDTAALPHVLKQYSAQSALWAEIPTVYVRIGAEGIGRQFQVYDGVTVGGVAAHETGAYRQLQEINGSKVIYAKDDDYIVVVGVPGVGYVQTEGQVTVSRTMPDLDFITEASNRLWGCRYGMAEGKTVNEIYCCALGNFKNWNRFLGISTDSYVASVGSDGPWTGAVTHLGCPVFFKEHCLHKVYISGEGAHQIVETACRGVAAGSHNSLSVVGETLLYHSPTGICAYDGSLPVPVSDVLGDVRYQNAVGGSLGDKYYVSMCDETQNWHLFVYDRRRGLFHREDSTRALAFANCGGELYYIDGDTNALMCVSGSQGTLESEIFWQADTGVMGYTTTEQKYIGRFNLRIKLEPASRAEVLVEYDSDGQWHSAGTMESKTLTSFMLPVRLRRCDHFRIRLQGHGGMKLYSFSKLFEKGSDEIYR